MGAKDSVVGFKLYAENNQEAYDNMVMAYNIAENKDVMTSYYDLSGWFYYKPCCKRYGNFR